MNDNSTYQLAHRDEIIFEGTESECHFELLKICSRSSNWIAEYTRYSIDIKQDPSKQLTFNNIKEERQ